MTLTSDNNEGGKSGNMLLFKIYDTKESILFLIP